MKFRKVRSAYIAIVLICMVLYFVFRNTHHYVVDAFSIIISISTLYFLFLLIDGAIHIQRNFFFFSHNQLPDDTEKKLVLSFDDGIHPLLTPRILDILHAHQIKALFFIIGKNIEGNENILQRMFNEGHTIGNHSDEHSFWFDVQSSKGMLAEIVSMNKKVSVVLGDPFKPKYFRPPYGVSNPALAKAIHKSGMISIGWNLRSMDTTMHSKEQLLQKLKSETKPGCIVLLHDRCEITAEALTDYIVFCKAQGYTFTTIT
ncbi:MAG: polysaccharide deacetylase family protein [Bacteroidetes bacterium]|nr:polysaccharide deacetylase family protein [Bacteroidota bacterium]